MIFFFFISFLLPKKTEMLLIFIYGVKIIIKQVDMLLGMIIIIISKIKV